MSARSTGGGGRGGKPGSRRKASSGKGASGFTSRAPTAKVKTAKGRKTSSVRWLQRQLNDPYVAEAKRLGYRSRAAFKLIEMDDKLGLIRRGARVVDLGAAPGGWAQVALERGGEGARVVGIDLLPIEPLAGADFIEGDFREEATRKALRGLLGGPADLVLSDMAAAATGHAQTDHLRIIALAEEALDFAEAVLAKGGGFVAKVLQGGSEKDLLDRLKRGFEKVRHVKPPASRKESAELYVVATGFRGET